MVTALIKYLKLPVKGVPRIVALFIGVEIVLPATLDLVLLKAVDNGRLGSCNAAHLNPFAFCSPRSVRPRSHLAECYLIKHRLSVTLDATEICIQVCGRSENIEKCVQVEND